MQQEVIQFTPPAEPEPFTSLFAFYAHLNLEKKRHQELLTRAYACYEDIRTRVTPKAVIATPAQIAVTPAQLCLDGVPFESPVFGQLSPEKLRQAFVYFLTVGDCPAPEGSLVDLLIYDTWGTVLVEATRAQLETYLQEKNAPLALSCSYGPGYFDIPRPAMLSLPKLADPTKIGIEVMENTLLLPQKSCAGIYLTATDATGFPQNGQTTVQASTATL